MPIYEYRCRACEHEFEELILRAADAAQVVCPRCAESEPDRMLSAPAPTGASCAPSGG